MREQCGIFLCTMYMHTSSSHIRDIDDCYSLIASNDKIFLIIIRLTVKSLNTNCDHRLTIFYLFAFPYIFLKILSDSELISNIEAKLLSSFSQ